MSATQATLTSARLTLEPLAVAHAEQVFALLVDPALYRWIPQQPPTQADALASRYGRIVAHAVKAAPERWLNWVARLRETGEYVGMVETTLNAVGEVYLAYFVFRDYQGRGYGSEACRTVLGHLAADYGAVAARAEIDTRNVASIALVERLGFQRTGFNAEADHFKGGPSDEYVYTRSLILEQA